MAKRRNKLKITSLLLVIVMVLSMLPMLSLTAFAAATELTVDITGADGNTKSVTLQDADSDGFYDIGTADELYAFAAEVNGGNGTINGELTADIVINENVLDENGELNGDGSNFRVWTPIGLHVDSYDAATVFHGQFNGNNHTVSGLYFNDENRSRVGLFGCTNGASIQNAGVLDCYINGNEYVGGVVGFLRSGTLENCYNAGNVLGDYSVGGVTGWAGKSSTIQNCFNNGNVSGKNHSIGGVVGYIYCVDEKTTLKNCYNTGSIVGQRSTRGVVGNNLGGTTENCFFLENTVTIGGALGNGSDVYAGTQAMSFAQFVSGEVAYKLGSAFGQTLAGENRQSYPVLGGTPVTDSERFEIYGQQLNLGGDLSMKYYVTAYAPDFDPAQLQIQFIHNGVVSTPKYEIVDGFYVFTLEGINPQCMGDSIDAYVYHGEVKKTEKLGYTVEENLNKLLEKYPDDAALVALINDTLAYGTASEKYKEYPSMKEEYPINEVTSVSSDIVKHTDNSGTVELVNVNVRFGTMNYLVFRFEGEGLSATSIFKIDDKAPAEIYMESENIFVVVSQPISPDKFYDNVGLRYYEGDDILIEIAYSINAYCDTIITGSGFSEEMTALAKALYNYGVSAEIYNHILTGEGEHTGGEATCVSGKICDICKTVYSEVDSANHTSDKYIYTDNGNGTHTQKHECCGASAGEPVDHIYEYTYNTTDTHSFTCTVCDITGKEDHTFTDNTCTVCGLIDATGMTAESLNTTVAKVLAEGKTVIAVNLAADAPAEMFTAIRRALIDTEGVADGSVHLTLAGVTSIPDDGTLEGIAFGPRSAQWDDNGVEIVPFETVTQLASVNLPDATTIGDYAFNDCRNLTVLTAPKVKTIGESAFASIGLTSVDLPEATTIEFGAFMGCTSLTTVKLPGATSIGNQAFLGSENITDLELTAEGAITLGTNVFNVPSQNFSQNVDLVLNENKTDAVEGTTWNGYTYKSITFAEE